MSATSTEPTTDQMITELRALPNLPTVHAQNMYAAAGWEPSAEHRAAITARVEFFRRWNFPNHSITIHVVDRSGATIGGLTFNS